MAIDEKLEDEKIKALTGKFAVCLWDGYPRMEPPAPEIVETFNTEEEAIKYSKEKNAELKREFYAKGGEQITPTLMLAYLMEARDRMIEPDYFVMDDRGCRID